MACFPGFEVWGIILIFLSIFKLLINKIFIFREEPAVAVLIHISQMHLNSKDQEIKLFFFSFKWLTLK